LDQKLRLKAAHAVRNHAKLLEPNRELKGLMDVRSTIYSDGTDTPTALVFAAWKHGLGTLVISDFYSLEGIEEAIEASRILGGPKIAPAVTLDFDATVSYKNARQKIKTAHIEFGHIALSFPLNNPNVKQWRAYKKSLKNDPVWQRLEKRQAWHRMKMDLIIGRWNQLHSNDGLGFTPEQEKSITAYPRQDTTILSLLRKLHPHVDLENLRKALIDERLYEAGTLVQGI